MKLKNIDLRLLIMDSGLFHKDIANQMKISPEWFCRCLARDLKPEMRSRILQAIRELQENGR